MYGFFEKFIEEIQTAYLEDICIFIPKYDELPKSIIENHAILSAQLIQNIKLPKYEKVNIQSVIKRLNNCLENKISDLNTIAFTDHTSNFRATSISLFFKKIGIDSLNQKIKEDLDFSKFLLGRLGRNANLGQTENNVIFSILKELAQRRNDISHGANIGDILNSSIYSDYFEFLREYAKALYSVLYKEMLKYECKANFKKVKLEKIFNKNILCLEVRNSTIKRNNRVIVRKGVEPNFFYFDRKILEININNTKYTKVKIKEHPVKIGLLLDGVVKANQEFYI